MSPVTPNADLNTAWAIAQMRFPFPWRVTLYQAWDGGKSRRHRRWYHATAQQTGAPTIEGAACRTAADALLSLAEKVGTGET